MLLISAFCVIGLDPSQRPTQAFYDGCMVLLDDIRKKDFGPGDLMAVYDPGMTAPTPSLLLEVWREVCRHLEIDESLGRIAPIVAQTLPATRLIVRRVEGDSRRLVTVAAGGTPVPAGQSRRETTSAKTQPMQT